MPGDQPPPDEAALPDPDQLRRQISWHLERAIHLRQILKAVNRIAGESGGSTPPIRPTSSRNRSKARGRGAARG